MSQLLHIQASPRAQRSRSIPIAEAFINAYSDTHPQVKVKTIDVWNMDLPEFNGDMLDAKYAVMSGQSPTQAQTAQWQKVEEIFNEFNQADTLLLSVPMWNFGIPYRLKHYIDVITQPGLAWQYTPEDGYQGLVRNKSAVVVYASGDSYADGTGFEAFDLQKPYVELWLNFIGVSKINTVKLESTLFADQDSDQSVIEQASKLGHEY